MALTSWKELFKEVVPEKEAIIAITISEEELERKFNAYYGTTEGTPFVAWSELWVYFSCTHDGMEFIERVPRFPFVVPHSIKHIGKE